MKVLEFIKARSLLFLIFGIVILSVGFIFISCGKGPQKKAFVCDKGDFAVDFSKAPLEKDFCYIEDPVTLEKTFVDCVGGIDGGTDTGNILPDIEEKEFTVEAWVMKSEDNPLYGRIFGRYEPKTGTMLWVKNNIPQFGIRIPFPSSTPGVSSTAADYVVSATGSLVKDFWTHIAGVLVNEAHTHPSSTSCTTAVMAETPHLDIYVNGIFNNCASTWGAADDPATDPQFIPKAVPGVLPAVPDQFHIGGISPDDISKSFEGVIDEVRFWVSEPGQGGARTKDQILECNCYKKDVVSGRCYGKELSFNDTGNCKIDPEKLKGYWRLNEGQGSTACDSSGNGFSAVIIASPPATNLWPNGWTDGFE